MIEKAILVDVNNFAFRYLHTVGAYSMDGKETATLYSMYKVCLSLLDLFGQDSHLVLVRDSAHCYRRDVFPGYKQKRKKDREDDPMLKDEMDCMHRQLGVLHDMAESMNIPFDTEYGYEADDIMARYALDNPAAQKIYLCTTDQDMYQCLEGNRVVMYNYFTKEYTRESDFRAKYGIAPCQWASVKAWSGCSSDSIPNVNKGVGEKTAIKFLQGTFKYPEKLTDHVDGYNRNIALVKLPYAADTALGQAKLSPRILPNTQVPINWEPLKEYIGIDRIPLGIK